MALSNALPNSILKPGVCTSVNRPSNPYEGQFIYETDTDALLVYNGTTWVLPSGPTGSPSNTNQFANKGYVDTSISTLQTSVGASISSLETSIAARPTINGASNRIIKATDTVSTTDSVGQVYIGFSTAFPSACETVVACSGDVGVPAATMGIVSKNRFGFTVRVFTENVVSNPFTGGFSMERYANGAVRVSYFATGY